MSCTGWINPTYPYVTGPDDMDAPILNPETSIAADATLDIAMHLICIPLIVSSWRVFFALLSLSTVQQMLMIEKQSTKNNGNHRKLDTFALWWKTLSIGFQLNIHKYHDFDELHSCSLAADPYDKIWPKEGSVRAPPVSTSSGVYAPSTDRHTDFSKHS